MQDTTRTTLDLLLELQRVAREGGWLCNLKKCDDRGRLDAMCYTLQEFGRKASLCAYFMQIKKSHRATMRLPMCTDAIEVAGPQGKVFVSLKGVVGEVHIIQAMRQQFEGLRRVVASEDGWMKIDMIPFLDLSTKFTPGHKCARQDQQQAVREGLTHLSAFHLQSALPPPSAVSPQRTGPRL